MGKIKVSLSSIVMAVLLITSWSYATTFTVTNLNDSGLDSLRWAIEQANANLGPDTIEFIVFGTIYPMSALPEITDNETVINASSQWQGIWPDGSPGITLNGTVAGNNVSGLVINTANYCHIQGLYITNFEGPGIKIYNSSKNNTIGGEGKGFRNVISGNQAGIEIEGIGTDRNVIVGNLIGTDITGLVGIGNGLHSNGIFIHDGACNNRIGGSGTNEGNVISGNYYGIRITGAGINGNIIIGNLIGTDITGTVGK